MPQLWNGDAYGLWPAHKFHPMKIVSGVLRLICGLALIIFAFATYQRIGAQVAAGQPIQIVGITMGASATQVNLGLIVVGLIGVFLMIFGVVTFLKKPAVVGQRK